MAVEGRGPEIGVVVLQPCSSRLARLSVLFLLCPVGIVMRSCSVCSSRCIVECLFHVRQCVMPWGDGSEQRAQLLP